MSKSPRAYKINREATSPKCLNGGVEGLRCAMSLIPELQADTGANGRVVAQGSVLLPGSMEGKDKKKRRRIVGSLPLSK